MIQPTPMNARAKITRTVAAVETFFSVTMARNTSRMPRMMFSVRMPPPMPRAKIPMASRMIPAMRK